MGTMISAPVISTQATCVSARAARVTRCESRSLVAYDSADDRPTRMVSTAVVYRSACRGSRGVDPEE
jgi:hypothetical protein